MLLYHSAGTSGFTYNSPLGIFTVRLSVGVSVFFLISGFLLYRPFAVSHLNGTPSPPVVQFWIRRLLRIVPGYWLALTVTNYVLHSNTGVTGWKSAIFQYGFAQIYSRNYVLSGITQAWSLCTEMSFYIFLPLFAALVVGRRLSPRNQVRRELVAMAVLAGFSIAFQVWSLQPRSPVSLATTWLPSYLDLFAVGMALAVISAWMSERRIQPPVLWARRMPWISWACAGITFWFMAHLGGPPKLLFQHVSAAVSLSEHALEGLFALFLLLPAIFGPQDVGAIRRLLQSQPVVAFGIVSYGIYLWHQEWITMFLRWTRSHPLHVQFVMLSTVVLILSLASAGASYILVERPALRLKGRFGSPGVPTRMSPLRELFGDAFSGAPLRSVSQSLSADH